MVESYDGAGAVRRKTQNMTNVAKAQPGSERQRRGPATHARQAPHEGTPPKNEKRPLGFPRSRFSAYFEPRRGERA